MKVTSKKIRRIVKEEMAGQGRPWGGARESKNPMNESGWDPTELLDQWGADQIGEAYVEVMSSISPDATADDIRAEVENKLEEMFGEDYDDDDLGIDIDDDFVDDAESEVSDEPDDMMESIVRRWNKAAGTLKG